MKGTVLRLRAEETHPWFIISDELDGGILAVNITDRKHQPDSTCLVDEGEHEVVTKDSAVVYRRAQVFDVAMFKKNVDAYANVAALCPTELLDKIVAGALHEESGLPRGMRKYIQ